MFDPWRIHGGSMNASAVESDESPPCLPPEPRLFCPVPLRWEFGPLAQLASALV